MPRRGVSAHECGREAPCRQISQFSDRGRQSLARRDSPRRRAPRARAWSDQRSGRLANRLVWIAHRAGMCSGVGPV